MRKKDPRPRRGRSNRPMNLGALPKTLQMLGSDWWYPKAVPKRLRPLRGRCFIRFAVRGCRFAQPLANSLNPFGVLLLPQRLVYNDESGSLGTGKPCLQPLVVGCADEGGASFAIDALRSSAHPTALCGLEHLTDRNLLSSRRYAKIQIPLA